MAELALKVCGIIDCNTAVALSAQGVRYLGFNFVASSPRCVPAHVALDSRVTARRVGIFVNATPDRILHACSRLSLTVVQLHGEESLDDILTLRSRLPPEVAIWKALGIADEFPAPAVDHYREVVDAFLFDRACPGRGGSGQRFDLRLIPAAVRTGTPHLIAGGIGRESLQEVLRYAAQAPALIGIDINSAVERGSPGQKDLGLIRQIQQEVVVYGGR